jgi:hypothetical protein
MPSLPGNRGLYISRYHRIGGGILAQEYGTSNLPVPRGWQPHFDTHGLRLSKQNCVLVLLHDYNRERLKTNINSAIILLILHNTRAVIFFFFVDEKNSVTVL